MLNDSLDTKQDKLTNPLTKSDVVNNLTSTVTNVPLSAYQGKVLNTAIAGKSKVTVSLISKQANGCNAGVENSLSIDSNSNWSKASAVLFVGLSASIDSANIDITNIRASNKKAYYVSFVSKITQDVIANFLAITVS